MKFKKGVELSEKGKALVCPRCENEEPGQVRYCEICGADLIQKCIGDNKAKTPCEAKIASNARYCPECGGKTSFYNSGYLDDWEKELPERVKTEKFISSMVDMLDGKGSNGKITAQGEYNSEIRNSIISANAKEARK